jgi:hypothetical protein
MSIPLIYIDESGFSENIPRTFGSALEGARYFGKHDWTAKRRTHVVGALAGNIMRIETVEQGV